MSKSACPYDPPNVGYPPIRYSAEDEKNIRRIDEIKAAAPFGMKNGKPIDRIGYQIMTGKRLREVRKVELRWPFWAGIGAGGLAILGLVFSRKS